ncbi:MAG: hypothetical protein LC708_02315 [Actinobacteria bacterium]|nr:hypothetical protein [Actinomycetota bacterium]
MTRRGKPGRDRVVQVELVCRCGRVLDKHSHSPDGPGNHFSAGDRLGVVQTIERPGPDGSRRYCCPCGYERVVPARVLMVVGRQAALALLATTPRGPYETTLAIDAVADTGEVRL